jgi:SAM-dependent methyltransferase
MSDKEHMDNFNTFGVGLEIAPYYNPRLLKSECNVLYTDYIDTDEIRAKALENPHGEHRIPPSIDFVWHPGAPLKNCAPNMVFDFALAAHVMEHVPNPIGWLNDILATMKTGGTLRLFLPDRRNNNDYFRHETTFAELVASWLERPPVPTPAQVCDFLSLCLDDRKRTGFAPTGEPLNIERAYTDKEAVDFATFVYNERQYIDVHCTVWTPDSFVREMTRVANAGMLNVDITPVFSSPLEFSVDLKKRGEPTLLPSAKIYPLSVQATLTPVAIPQGSIFRRRAARALRRVANYLER